MAGEFLRETEGLTDSAAYFDRHWPLHVRRFDESGMYMDPSCPMLYDLVARSQLLYIIGFGYNGKYAEEMDRYLQAGALGTLLSQSSAFLQS